MAETQHPSTRWVLVTDNRWARLVRLTKSAPTGWHADELKTMRSEWEEHHERHDQLLPDRNPRGDVPEHFPGWAHKKEEETRRFAHQVAAWLERLAGELEITKIAVFAPDHFLGPLRASWSPRIRSLVTEHAADLTHLRPQQLLEHPAIVPLLSPAETR